MVVVEGISGGGSGDKINSKIETGTTEVFLDR